MPTPKARETPTSRDEYLKVISEWIQRGRQPAPDPKTTSSAGTSAYTVARLLLIKGVGAPNQ